MKNLAFGNPRGFRVGFSPRWSNWGIRWLYHPGYGTKQLQFELGHIWFKLPERMWS